jgi:hypothetical protein
VELKGLRLLNKFVLLEYEKYKYLYCKSTNTKIYDSLLLLNDWWKTGEVSKELLKPYKRKVFAEVLRLVAFS